MYGGRTSLFVSLVAALITTLFAVSLGLLAGYFRGRTDAILSRLLDVVWAFPVLLLGIALGTALAVGGLKIGPLLVSGDSIWIPIMIIGLVCTRYMARPIRGEILARREKEFVGAAVAAGRGVSRHGLRAAAEPLVDDHRVLHPEHRQQHAAGVGAVLSRRRLRATQLVVGDDDLGRIRLSTRTH